MLYIHYDKKKGHQ
ncbi:Protein of unknown function [Bacillus cytotoxicus]|uniref:Uncharacterized protein n=1 Tax=Bacillus cytotoxicus TaxID=580165 RepID=A0AAX2CCV7_9BACI|nr:Protein of unknown function [Bacillus cytotoxicus]